MCAMFGRRLIPALEEESLSLAATVQEPKKVSKQQGNWAGLLWRTLAWDVFACARCGGRRKVLAYLRAPEGCVRFWSTWDCSRRLRSGPRHRDHASWRGAEPSAATTNNSLSLSIIAQKRNPEYAKGSNSVGLTNQQEAKGQIRGRYRRPPRALGRGGPTRLSLTRVWLMPAAEDIMLRKPLSMRALRTSSREKAWRTYSCNVLICVASRA